MLKATKVDGVYSADPIKHPDAVKYDKLTYDEILDKKLGVMDLTAICLSRDHNLPVRVFNMNKQKLFLILWLVKKKAHLSSLVLKKIMLI